MNISPEIMLEITRRQQLKTKWTPAQRIHFAAQIILLGFAVAFFTLTVLNYPKP